MPETTLRDWLALLATSLSALFAGLIWWMARKRLNSRFTLTIDNLKGEIVGLRVTVLNRGDAPIADSDDCGHLFRLKADSDSDRSRTAFR